MRQVKGEQVRRELLPGQSVELLRELHLVGRDGALHADSLRKLKQVNHLVQLLEPAVRDVLARYQEPVLVDAGAGNAYLGFVLYELFLREHPTAVIYSVESRPELIERGQERAKKLGFDRMRFVPARIGDAPDVLPARVHMVLALHACDTATDDALARAIGWEAPLVLAAPCCHHDIAAQLRRQPTPAPYAMLTRHGILRERFADTLTDGLRASLLRLAGYRVDVMQFVGSQHTPRNTLLRALRTGRPVEGGSARREYDELVAAWGVRPRLAELLADA
jgi:hypothetical protein